MITLDTREPEDVLVAVEAAAVTEGIHTTRAILQQGDFVWECPLGTVGVERKTASDLMGSLSSGRAAEQMARMIEAYTIPVLMIVGDLTTHKGKIGRWSGKDFNGSWTVIGVDNVLLSWQLAGMYIVRASKKDTAARIISLYRWSHKREHLVVRGSVITPTHITRQARTLCTLPGIGPKRAASLAKQYTLAELFAMPESVWQKMAGKTIGERVNQFINARDINIINGPPPSGGGTIGA